MPWAGCARHPGLRTGNPFSLREVHREPVSCGDFEGGRGSTETCQAMPSTEFGRENRSALVFDAFNDMLLYDIVIDF